MTDWVGGSYASSSPTEITALSQLTAADLPTRSEITAMIRAIDIRLVNLAKGGAVRYQENGETGHLLDESLTVQQLRELREHYIDALSDLEQTGDVEILLSQWDNPRL